MPAVLEIAAERAAGGGKRAVPPQLARYAFQPGHKKIAGSGRAVGQPNAASIYLESLPIKARQWVKSTDARILSEARQLTAKLEQAPELLLPSDRSASVGEAAPTIIFMVTTSGGQRRDPLNITAEIDTPP